MDALNALLWTMDRRMRRRKLVRGRAETLHAFARRVRSAGSETAPTEAAAAWYTAYAEARYRGRVDKETVRRLQDTMVAVG